MTKRSICDDKTQLVAYLYGEGTPDELQTVAEHIAGCEACRFEVDGLTGLRGHLSEWTPPERVLGFRMVRETAPQNPGPRPWWRSPAWGLAAAAVLLIAVAASVARLEIRYDDRGFVVRTGWGTPLAEPSVGGVAPVAADPMAASPAPWAADLRALEERLRQASASPPPVTATSSSAAAVDLLPRVRALIADSEARQEREIALRFAQLVRDVDQQRRSDWTRIQQGFVRLEDLTGAGVAQQREMLNYLMRVSREQR